MIAGPFQDAVDMAPAELDRWLGSEDSRAVGWRHEGEGESVGHHVEGRIVAIKRTRKADLTDDDQADMRKVIGYVHRHMAQRPIGADSRHRSLTLGSVIPGGAPQARTTRDPAGPTGCDRPRSPPVAPLDPGSRPG